MARSIANTVTTVYRSLSHLFVGSHECNEPNIGLQESRGLSSPAVYFDDPAQESSQHQPHYSDDPDEEVLQPQTYVSPVDGKPCPLQVQSTTLGGALQPAGNWLRVNVSGHADPIFRLSAWTTSDGHQYANPAYRTLAWLAALIKATILSPIYSILIWRYVNANGSNNQTRTPIRNLPQPIPREYPKFLGRCHEYPKYTPNNLNVRPASSHTRPGNEDNRLASVYTAKEQKRLYNPRKLFVKIDNSWLEMDGDSLQAERPYVFISYAANQFQRSTDPSGRLVLTEEASQRLKERAIAVAEQNGLDAYWIDFLRATEQPEATDDVHRFCDVVRDSKLVCVLLAEDKDMANSLARFGKRLWCLPECLLAPKHKIYVQGGGKSEIIDIIKLPARAWTKSYVDDSGHVVEGKGKKEEFRLLAEHFSDSLSLGPKELFSVALSALRTLEYFPFQNGDIAYALMALLSKRPAMDPTDSEQQALARLCFSNDSDRLLERIVCVLPSKDDGYDGWFTTDDSFNVNVWDIVPLCQVAGICNSDAIIVDGCHGISISWESIPRILFKTRKTAMKKIVLSLLWSSFIWMYLAIMFFVILAVVLTFVRTRSVSSSDNDVRRIVYYSELGLRGTISFYLGLSFVSPFCMRWIYGGQIMEVQPHLIGIEGTMPIEQLERLAFGTGGHGWLEYSASNERLCSRDSQTRTGIPPTIDPQSLPTGHRVFTLLDTVSSQSHIISSAKLTLLVRVTRRSQYSRRLNRLP